MKKQTIKLPIVFDLDDYEIKNIIGFHFSGWLKIIEIKTWNRIILN